MGLSTVETFKRMKLDDAVELDAAELRRLQLTLAGMVRDFAAFCEAEGIPYFLGGGTSLGALRHGGFIPWDDDADVCVSRNDFGRFVAGFTAACGERYYLHTPQGTPGLGLALARIRLKGTSVRTREDVTSDNPRIATEECGAFVDVFIVDDVPDGRLARLAHGAVSLLLGFLYSCSRFYHDRRTLSAWSAGNPALRRALRLKAAVGFFTSWMGQDGWTRLWDRWNGLCRGGRTRDVAIPVGKRHYFGEIARREDYFGTRTVSFEGFRVRCPERLEEYLTRLYGPDYMTPQDPGDRERHVFFKPFSLGDCSVPG